MTKPEIKKQMSLIFFFRTVHHRNKDLKQNSLKFYEGSDACKILLWTLIADLTNICSSCRSNEGSAYAKQLQQSVRTIFVLVHNTNQPSAIYDMYIMYTY